MTIRDSPASGANDETLVGLIDPTSGVRVKVNSSGEMETTANVGDITLEELLGLDNFADMSFDIVTVGAAGDTVRYRVPDLSIDVTYTLIAADAADSTGLVLRDNIITALNADATFKLHIDANNILDNPIIHVQSFKLGEIGEHLDAGDVVLSSTGTTVVNLPTGNDILKRRNKIFEVTRNVDDRRFGTLGVSGDMVVTRKVFSDRFSENAKDGSTISMAVDGSSVTKTYLINSVVGFDLFIKTVKFSLKDQAIKFGSFGNLSTLTNGVAIELISDGITTTFDVIKDTDGFQADFADPPSEFRLHNQTGTSFLTVAIMLDNPVILRASSGDQISVKIRDNLTGLTRFDFKVVGFRKAV